MVNVSKHKLKNKVMNQINDRLIDTIYKLENSSSTKSFLNDLLSESERITLAKRLSVIFMLQEDISWYRISRILKVSQTTVQKIAIDIGYGEYKNILKIVKVEKNRMTFWEGLDKVLKCGMPPIVGKGRWNFLDDSFERFNFNE